MVKHTKLDDGIVKENWQSAEAWLNRNRSDIEKLVEKFNQWADDRIDVARSTPFISYKQQQRLCGRIDAYEWAKTNLERLAREVLAE